LEADVHVKVTPLLTAAQAVQTSAAPAVFFQNPAAQATTSLLVADVQVKAVPDKELATTVQAVQTSAAPAVFFQNPAAQAMTLLLAAVVHVKTVRDAELATTVQAVHLAASLPLNDANV